MNVINYQSEVQETVTPQEVRPILALWAAVLVRAYIDAWGAVKRDREAARRWISDPGSTFVKVCLAFDVDPEKARERMLSTPPSTRRGGPRRAAEQDRKDVANLDLHDWKHARIGRDRAVDTFRVSL